MTSKPMLSVFCECKAGCRHEQDDEHNCGRSIMREINIKRAQLGCRYDWRPYFPRVGIGVELGLEGPSQMLLAQVHLGVVTLEAWVAWT